MKTNEELQRDVQDAIKWEPLLNAAEIGVICKDGVVTLTGTVNSYAKKSEAENAAKNVAGVKVVIEKIDVKFDSSSDKIDDTKIAADVLNAIEWNWKIPNNKVKVRVENGWITLDGQLNWDFQREAAKEAVRSLPGVKGVTNNIIIRPESNDLIEKREVEKALSRSWINTDDINVDVKGTKVTLTGIVGSPYQREEAERIAWKTKGIWSVDNQLTVDYDYYLMD